MLHTESVIMPNYKIGVYVGRFQPFHNAHLSTIRFALENVENLIVVIGSAHRTRNTKNPFTDNERQEMISACLMPEELKRIWFVPVRDYLYIENRWITEIQHVVDRLAPNVKPSEVAIIGYRKDPSSYYLKSFPQWARIETPMFEGINATDIRAKYFATHRAGMIGAPGVPNSVGVFLEKFKSTPAYKTLAEEYAYILAYKTAWAAAPFPPTFVTVDAVVVKSGHVLVVKRKGTPGKGNIALPGGFLDAHEFIEDGALRELKEETGIKESLDTLRANVKIRRVFDDPMRSIRGRTITHAFLIDLGSGDLPKVKGGDDAAKAWWLPLSEFLDKEAEFFEDHFHIINNFINEA